MWFELKKSEHVFFLVVALIGRSANIFVLDDRTTVLRSLKSESPARWGNRLPSSPALGTPKCRRNHSHPFMMPTRYAFPVSERIEASHSLSERSAWIEDQRHQQIAHLRKHVKKIQRRITKLTQDLEKVSAYREYGRYGELLKNHVSAMGRGQKHITVVDYFDEQLPELTLPLDPEKDGPGNLKAYFTKHGKFAGAQKNLVPRIEETKNELGKLQNELQELESGKVTDQSKQEDDQGPAQSVPPPQDPQRSGLKRQTAIPYRQFYSQDGQAILVGKTAKDNDAVTFKVSKPDDLWLHARGTPGSHVVIKLEKKQQVPPETLKDAANLALFYSDLRKSGKGEVIYTLRKNVRKPKGAKPGSVMVTQEKSLWVFVDQARLDRLKESVDQVSLFKA